MRKQSLIAVVSVAALLAGALDAHAAPIALEGFKASPHFDEQVLDFAFDPGVTVHVNAPAATAIDSSRPTRLVIYALPNGNTIAQTIGKRLKEGDDWHFDIQHIGAQIRRLREIVTDADIVVAYVEVDGRSWPRWRQNHENPGRLVQQLINDIRERLGDLRPSIELASHSGGGAMIFALLDEFDQIPADIQRIVFIDSDYSYSDEKHHGEKLLAWLQADPSHHLCVMAYDDRNIELNGKKIIGPAGGTWRRTHDMIARLGKDIELTESHTDSIIRHRGMNGQVDILLHENPDNKILHTVLVEKNGLIHALTTGTKWEDCAGKFFTDRAYGEWIRSE